MDFKKSILENRRALSRPFIAAHRGICGGNIPCNTLASYKIALDQGADVIEIDVSKSKDGEFFVFHPGMEPAFLCQDISLSELYASEIDELRLVNQDNTPTSYKIPRLSEVLALLKGKAYINVDKFWTDIPGISHEIRLAGVEDQVIVKTAMNDAALEQVKRYASDFMFMPIISGKDEITDRLIEHGIKLIAAEVLFDKETDEVISDAYIRAMHERGLLIWANSIVYNEKAVISAYHTDDISLTDDPDKGWGWLIDKGVDFIQTDWLLALRSYIDSRK